MLRAVIVSPDAELSAALEDLLANTGTVSLVKATNRYLTSYDLERFMRANAPQVVFLDIAGLDEAVQCHRGMDTIIPGVQTIAFGRRCDSDVLLALMNLGIREFLPAPLDYSALINALTRIHEILEKRPARIDICDNVFAFLPSKAGAGTSTIALNTAIALSSRPDQKTLLVDMDLNSGLLAARV